MMIAQFLNFIKKNNLIEKKDIVLIAISGGIDSVVMTDLFQKTHYRFGLAYVNFNLRSSKEIFQEQILMKQLAQKYQVELHSKYVNTQAYSKKHGISIQIAARNLRYNWFYSLMQKYGYSKIATAHHLDDNLETLILNFIRFPGLKGLMGIPLKRESIIRPMLFTSKRAITVYAKKYNLTWCEDISNQKNFYQRNFIRNQIIPLFKQLNPNLEKNILPFLDKIQAANQLITENIITFKEKHLIQEDNLYYLKINELKKNKTASLIISEILHSFGFHFKQIHHLLKTNLHSGKQISSKKYDLLVNRDSFIIQKKQLTKVREKIAIGKNIQKIKIDDKWYSCKNIPKVEYEIPNKSSTHAFDQEKLTFPLIIRTWQVGDYFYPLGMPGKKKVSDFLIDLKLNNFVKKQIRVILSAFDIISILGYRIHEHYKITPDTTTVYELKEIG